MTPDLKQLTDLVREMRDAMEAGLEIIEDKEREIGMRYRKGDMVRSAIARADALIGPGDGFAEIEKANAEVCDGAP